MARSTVLRKTQPSGRTAALRGHELATENAPRRPQMITEDVSLDGRRIFTYSDRLFPYAIQFI